MSVEWDFILETNKNTGPKSTHCKAQLWGTSKNVVRNLTMYDPENVLKKPRNYCRQMHIKEIK